MCNKVTSYNSITLRLGTADGPQWALGGDTWIVGCRIPDCTVFPEFNVLNPDQLHPVYGTEYGIYKPNCGLQNVMFAYGHDEYMYQMLVRILFIVIVFFLMLLPFAYFSPFLY